jgi:hypothetical protein
MGHESAWIFLHGADVERRNDINEVSSKIFKKPSMHRIPFDNKVLRSLNPQENGSVNTLRFPRRCCVDVFRAANGRNWLPRSSLMLADR